MEQGDYYGVSVDGNPLLLKFVSTDGETTVIRCDDRDADGNCYTKTSKGGQCTDSYSTEVNRLSSKFPSLPDMVSYDSVDFPVTTSCPNGTEGCSLYCDDFLKENCVIVDNAGHFLQTIGLVTTGATWNFYEEPSMDVFKVEKCEEGELPAPVDYCSSAVTQLTPRLPCKFQMEMSGSVVSGVSTNDHPQYLFDVSIPVLSVNFTLRCDKMDSNGRCYRKVQSAAACFDGFDVDDGFGLSELFSGVTYNSSVYPVTRQCPNKTDGCREYCNVLGECATVDNRGIYLEYKGLVVTEKDDLSLSVFETTDCAGVAIAAPTSVQCQQGPNPPPAQSSSSTASSAASSSTTSTSTSTSTSVPVTPSASVNSASCLKVTFVFVVVVIALALL